MTDERQTPGMRQAALALHATTEADRAWLLSRMPEPRRSALLALVDELDKLGFAPDPSVLRRALSSRSPDRDNEREPWDPRLLATALAGEPALVSGIVNREVVDVPPRLARSVREQVARAASTHSGAAARGTRSWLGRIGERGRRVFG